MLLSNDNPDFYRTTISEPETVLKKTTVIYSTLAEMRDQGGHSVGGMPLAVGQVIGASEFLERPPSSRNLTIYALDLVLADRIEIPGGRIRICCRRLRVPKGIVDKQTGVEKPGAILDVSPQPDPKYLAQWTPVPAQTSQPGESGDKVAKAVNSNSGQVYGYKYAADETPQYGVDGANAGSIEILCDEIELEGTLLLLANGARGNAGCNGQDGGAASDQQHGRGGAGGKGGNAGNGGDGGQIRVHCRTINQPDHLQARCEPGEAGESGSPGGGGSPNGLPGGDADPRSSGDGGLFDPRHGDRFKLSELGSRADEIFFLKVLQKAKFSYLFNQPKQFSGSEIQIPDENRWRELGGLLQWIWDALHAYSEDTEKDAGALRKAALVKEATVVLSKYNNKKTYFGWPADWVPSLPFEAMLVDFTRSMDAREKLEKSFLAMNKEYEDKTKAQAALDESRVNIDAATKIHQAKYQYYYEQLNSRERSGVLGSIQAADAECTAAAGDLNMRLKDLWRVVQDKTLKLKNCQLDSVLDAASMMAFTMGDPAQFAVMGGVQGVKLVEESLNKLQSDDGKKIDRDSLAKKIVGVGNDIVSGTLQEAFTIVDGKPKLTSDNVLLMTTLDKFEAELTSVKKALDGEQDIDKIIHAIDRFKTAIREKGEARLMYQIYAMNLASEYEKYREAKAKAAELDKQIDPLTPYWVATASYFAKLYQDQLEAAIEEFSLLQRKYAYVTLDHEPELNLIREAGRLWLDGAQPDNQTMSDLRTKADQLSAEINKYKSELSSPRGLVPEKDSNVRSDIRLMIDVGDDLLGALRSEGRVTFTTVSPGFKATGEHPIVNPRLMAAANNYWDVRVTNVMPRLIGATNPSKKVFIGIKATTWSCIEGSRSEQHTFSHHYSRVTSFVHKADSSPDSEDDSDYAGGLKGNLQDEALDCIGLYTTWTLSVPPGGDNPDKEQLKAALKNVSALKIYFNCWARTKSMKKGAMQ